MNPQASITVATNADQYGTTERAHFDPDEIEIIHDQAAKFGATWSHWEQSGLQ